VGDRPLQPLDGRREAPGRQRMGIRSADGAARSVRAIDPRISCGPRLARRVPRSRRDGPEPSAECDS